MWLTLRRTVFPQLNRLSELVRLQLHRLRLLQPRLPRLQGRFRACPPGFIHIDSRSPSRHDRQHVVTGNCWAMPMSKAFSGHSSASSYTIGTTQLETKRNRTSSSTLRCSTIGGAVTRPSAITPRPSSRQGQLWLNCVSMKLGEGQSVADRSLLLQLQFLARDWHSPNPAKELHICGHSGKPIGLIGFRATFGMPYYSFVASKDNPSLAHLVLTCRRHCQPGELDLSDSGEEGSELLLVG